MLPPRLGQVTGHTSFATCLENLSHDQSACVLVDLHDLERERESVFERIETLDGVPGLVVVADHITVPQTVSMLRAGADDVIERPIDAALLESAVGHALAESQAKLEEVAEIRLLREQWSSLHERERTVVRMLLFGMTSEAIAQQLETSTRTIDRRRRKILDIMQEATLIELAARLGKYHAHWS